MKAQNELNSVKDVNKNDFFSYVQNNMKRQESVNNLLTEEGKMLTGNKEMWGLFSSYFCSVLSNKSISNKSVLPGNCENLDEGPGFKLKFDFKKNHQKIIIYFE